MRILALDIGDRWTGIAISDPLGITARPYKTIDSALLFETLSLIITKERVGTIIVGYPETLRGTESEQTKKIVTIYEAIQKHFSSIECLLRDERFTSQQAAKLKKATNKEEKLDRHAVAAAFILSSYLDYLEFQKADD